MGGPQEEALRGLREGPGQGVASSPQLQAAQGVANDLQTRMPGGPKIRVVETTEEIASEYGARVAGRLMRNRPEAFYDPRTDTVVVIAENAHPIEGESHEAYFTLKILREAAGHGGLSRLFHNPEAQPSVFLFANWVAVACRRESKTSSAFGKWSKIFEARPLVAHSFLFLQNRQI